MAYINKIACDVMMKGWCDQLGKNPKNYLFVAALSLFFNYIIPVFTYLAILMFVNRDVVFGSVVMLLSPALPGITTLYLSSVSIVVVVLVIILIFADSLYLAYMMRQLGVLVLVPVAIEITRIAIIVLLPSWLWLAAILSAFPVMTLAVALHFAIYAVSRGVVAKQL